MAIKSLAINHYIKTKLTLVTMETNLQMSKMTIQKKKVIQFILFAGK